MTTEQKLVPSSDPSIVSDAIEILSAMILEWNHNHPDDPDDIMTDLLGRFHALAAAPAAPAQEPVVWRWRSREGGRWIYDPAPEWLDLRSEDDVEKQPLYAAPVAASAVDASLAAPGEG